MIRLEDLRPDMRIRGLMPYQIVTLIAVRGFASEGSDFYTVTVVYECNDGDINSRLLYREDEADLEIVQDERLWAFDADGKLLRLVSEAYRIHLAHLFDPVLAVHTSLIEPLPHQITAVYDEMLPRQPLRFLLADDPGAGKTIMAGLLIRELIARGDVRRCLICAPSKLSEQWRDELSSKFQLKFRIFTRDMMKKASQDENPFEEDDQLIVSLDQVKRNEYMDRLRPTNWDLVVCDEAHQMSANFFGKTKTARYRLGELLGKITRHFLLMTATPHNGKEGDFQLFMELLDEERFKGRLWDDIRRVDASDLMRRMIKEDLRNFDGTPLFPERKAYTSNYELSPEEDDLYEKVTKYVCDEFKHAKQLKDGRKFNSVSFAMTSLQRRLASSPEAIYQSLKSRRQRLENRLEEGPGFLQTDDLSYDEEDFEDLPASEREEKETEFVDRATAASNIEELKDEIDVLYELEAEALQVRLSGNDRKWKQLRSLFDDVPEMQNVDGTQRKLVIFTEYRATLNYLIENLQTLFSHPDAIVTIHGNIPLDKRRETEERFRNDPKALILVATDAAGEGINLQCANLMVNYDLPWNPNRLEQRFGRIHRIGQNEVCHLWNLVAQNTREGQVYHSLLEKLRTESDALDGQVFDVLGTFFQETSLRKLLKEAVRYGDRPEVRAKLEEAIDNTLDQERVRELLEKQALVTDNMDTSRIMQHVQTADARRLQPFYVKAFFREAFEHFGGTISELKREDQRYAINHVPSQIRSHANERGMRVVKDTYRRICFEKTLIHLPNKPEAELICPGHPLLDATIDLMLQRERDILKQGAVLVDEGDYGDELRVLFYLDQKIRDARPGRAGDGRAISREVHFIEIDSADNVCEAGVAPYLDYRPAANTDKAKIEALLEQDWLKGKHLENRALEYARIHLVPRHREEVRAHHIKRINKNKAAVQELLKEQQKRQRRCQQEQREQQEYLDQHEKQERRRQEQQEWSERFEQQEEQKRQERFERLSQHQLLELIEQQEWRMRERHLQEEQEYLEYLKQFENLEQLKKLEQRLREWGEQLEQRQRELEQELEIYPAQPIIVGGALIIPIGLLEGRPDNSHLKDRRVTENVAMQAVMQAERELGNQPEDVSKHNEGYDIKSRDGNGGFRFIEVKGRRAGAETVTLTRNELITALNCGEKHILALVEVEGTSAHLPHYLRGYPFREPGPLEHSVNFKLKDLMKKSKPPS